MHSNRALGVASVVALLSGGAVFGQEGPRGAQPTLPQGPDGDRVLVSERRSELSARRLRGLRPDVVMSILSAQPGGDISLEVLAASLPTRQNAVALFVEIDGVSYLRAARGPVSRVDVYGYALSSDGGVVDHFADAFVVDLSAVGERLWKGGFRFVAHLELPPSSFELRILVREHQSGATGLRIVHLDTSSSAAGGPLVSIPILPSPKERDGWLTVRESAPHDPSFQHAGRAVLPASLPIIMSGRTFQGYLPARGVPEKACPGHLVFTPKTGPATRVPAVFQPPLGSQPAGVGLREFHAEMPVLTGGEYSLHAELQAAGQLLSGPSISTVVVAPSSRNRSLVWTDLRDLPPAADSRQARQAGRSRKRKPMRKQRQRAAAVKRGREITRRYASVLASWSADRTAVARADLLTLEAAVLSPGSNVTFEELLAAELGVLEKLAAHDPESLVPVIVLHQEIYLTYRQRHLFSLAAHARAMIERTTKLYTARTASQGARLISADALTSLGGLLLESNLLTASRRLFRDSLELAPGRRTPQLALATSHERYGEFGRALEILEVLHAAHPTFGEATLRLAVNLGRVGRKDRSEELLSALDSPEQVGWVRSLARQELARRSFERGDVEIGSSLLESVDETERSLSELVLLAHLYDRAGRHHSSLELLGGARSASSHQGSSPRKTYDSWPEALLDETRLRLSRAAAVRMSTLAETVAERWPS